MTTRFDKILGNFNLLDGLMISGANHKMREYMSFLRSSSAGRKLSYTEAGFSLVELAIVMVIIGLLAAPLIGEYGRYQIKKHRDDTKINLAAVNDALGNFYAANGRYPCPADRTIAFGNANRGLEQCAKILLLGANACSTNNGYCRATQAAGKVDIGAVPYETLKIPYSQTIDGWGNDLSYAVTEIQTVKATFDSAKGAVAMVDENGNSLGNMHGIIISAGEDGAGSFNINGKSKPCNAVYAEAENCDNDATFLSSLRYEVQNNKYYDDIVLPSSWVTSGIWTYAGPDNITNTNIGNVGIGTTTPTVKLDVVGNIKADNLQSPQYCNTSGGDCMVPDAVGGAGSKCPTGQVAVGIANNTVTCQTVTVPPGTGSCPPGQYVTKITSAGVECAAP